MDSQFFFLVLSMIIFLILSLMGNGTEQEKMREKSVFLENIIWENPGKFDRNLESEEMK